MIILDRFSWRPSVRALSIYSGWHNRKRTLTFREVFFGIPSNYLLEFFFYKDIKIFHGREHLQFTRLESLR